MVGNNAIVAYAGLTDAGRVRANNEDAFGILGNAPGDGVVAVVADGMGGAEAGEQASRLAVNIVTEAFRVRGTGLSAREVLAAAFRQANDRIFAAGENDPPNRRRGSTCTALVIEDSRYYIAHVGDSRAYSLRAGVLTQITQDHSLVAEAVAQGMMTAADAEKSDRRNVITRALGAGPTVIADLHTGDVVYGDRFLLCTDGLTNEVAETKIRAVLAEGTPHEAGVTLVAAANSGGGRDNITAVIVMCKAKDLASPKRPFPKKPERTLVNRLLAAGLITAGIVTAFGAVYWFLVRPLLAPATASIPTTTPPVVTAPNEADKSYDEIKVLRRRAEQGREYARDPGLKNGFESTVLELDRLEREYPRLTTEATRRRIKEISGKLDRLEKGLSSRKESTGAVHPRKLPASPTITKTPERIKSEELIEKAKTGLKDKPSTPDGLLQGQPEPETAGKITPETAASLGGEKRWSENGVPDPEEGFP